MSTMSETIQDPKFRADALSLLDRILTFLERCDDQNRRKMDQDLRRSDQLLSLNEQHLRSEGLHTWGTPSERRRYVQSPQTRPLPRGAARELN